MSKPILLDAYSGAGGAARGYQNAGFYVVGVDIKDQPRYAGDDFILGDALDILRRLLAGEAVQGVSGRWYRLEDFAAIHASCPCQKFSPLYALPNVGEYPDLIEPTRVLLIATGKPYAIENVPGAPLINPIELCGTMFDLPLIRHRRFECNPPIWFPPAPHACQNLYTASSRGYSTYANGAKAITVAGHNYILTEGQEAMGIDWMTNRDELSEAIPPAYTEFIGSQLMRRIGGERG